MPTKISNKWRTKKDAAIGSDLRGQLSSSLIKRLLYAAGLPGITWREHVGGRGDPSYYTGCLYQFGYLRSARQVMSPKLAPEEVQCPPQITAVYQPPQSCHVFIVARRFIHSWAKLRMWGAPDCWVEEQLTPRTNLSKVCECVCGLCECVYHTPTSHFCSPLISTERCKPAHATVNSVTRGPPPFAHL